MLTIENRRRHSRIALVGEAVADGADVMIDAEDFLNDDDAALRRPARLGAIGTELETVGCDERKMLTQDDPPMTG